MILVSQAPNPLPDDGDDIIASTRHALANGFELLNLPTALMHVHEVDPALTGVPVQTARQTAVWIGTIPDEQVYRAVHGALLRRNIHLLNDPEAHLDVFEFDRGAFLRSLP